MAVLLLSALLALQFFSLGQRLLLWSGPVLSWTQQPVAWLHEEALWLESRSILQQHLGALEVRLGQQTALLQQTQSLQEENIRLRRLLHVQNIQGYQWHAVTVIGRSPDVKSQRLIVQTAAVSSDDVVVSSEGLVGLIDRYDAGYAVVRTILDASITVPVTLKGSDLAALARGDGKQLLLDFVPAVFALQSGDILYTSGAGGLYPPGIAVARIIQAEALSGSPFAHVEAVPIAHWQRDHWLAIATNASSLTHTSALR
jgi:rod shape-determining protein MreC